VRVLILADFPVGFRKQVEQVGPENPHELEELLTRLQKLGVEFVLRNGYIPSRPEVGRALLGEKTAELRVSDFFKDRQPYVFFCEVRADMDILQFLQRLEVLEKFLALSSGKEAA